MAEDSKPGLMLFDAKITVAQLLVVGTILTAAVSAYINLTRQIERVATVQENQIEQFRDFRREMKDEMRNIRKENR